MELFVGLICLLSFVCFMEGYGRMIDLFMRFLMWWYGFDIFKNYNDNELNCGGFVVSFFWFLLCRYF